MIGNIILTLFGIIIIGIVTMFIFGREDPKEVKKRVQEYEDKLVQQGNISSTFLVHLNGHPYLKPNDLIIFHIRNNTIYFENKNINIGNKSGTTDFIGDEVLISQLTRYEVKTETEINRDVTLTRLIALGIFAFGAKKKTETNTEYLILTYIDNGVEITCVFKQMQDKQGLGNIISILNRQRLNFNIV